jgi:Protein of unknown function (DUF2934)
MSETPKKATARKTAAKKKMVLSTESSDAPPTQEEVEMLAYQLWVDRGRRHGDDAQDWLRAEEQLRPQQ